MNIEKPRLVAKVLRRPEVKDYTYAILFFLISSFFAAAVIQPTLSKAFSLAKESDDLQTINEKYEENVTRIIDLQRKLEEMRSAGHLIDVAIPQSPYVQEIVLILQKIAKEENVPIGPINIDDIKYITDDSGNVKEININISTEADYTQMRRMVHRILNTRRLMNISSLNIERSSLNEDGSAYKLELSLEITGYYL
jgi:Tfp pilus assembly protein PilO